MALVQKIVVIIENKGEVKWVRYGSGYMDLVPL